MIFANYIEASISTVTAGAPDTFTLAAITGSPNFDKIPGITGTRYVRYTAIQYTDSTRSAISKIQSGIGSLVISTLVLTQTLIQETWDGTTYDNTAPAELTFTAGADTTRVIITPLAQDFLRTIPGTGNIDGSMGASTSFGNTPFNVRDGGSTFTATVDREQYCAILWAGQCQIDQVTLRTNSAATGNCKLVWFETAPDGKPGAVVKDFGAFAVGGTATNSVAAVTGFCPAPGWYWEGSIFDAAVVPFVRSSSVHITPVGQNSIGQNLAGYFRTGAYASGVSGSVATPTAIVAGNNMALPSFSYRMAA